MTLHIKKTLGNKLLIGRNEWCQLPELGVPAIKAKIDTGAKTSAIHAFNIKPVRYKRKNYVCFDIHPIQANQDIVVSCKMPLVDERDIMSSNGHKEHRFIIVTTLLIAHLQWEIELSLSNRDPLRYRLLLGRGALNGRVLIDPSIACNQGSLSKKNLLSLFQ